MFAVLTCCVYRAGGFMPGPIYLEKPVPRACESFTEFLYAEMPND